MIIDFQTRNGCHVSMAFPPVIWIWSWHQVWCQDSKPSKEILEGSSNTISSTSYSLSRYDVCFQGMKCDEIGALVETLRFIFQDGHYCTIQYVQVLQFPKSYPQKAPGKEGCGRYMSTKTKQNQPPPVACWVFYKKPEHCI